MGEALKILLLEDNITDAELILRVLRSSEMRFQYQLATDKHSFMLQMRRFQPDVVLADNSLPQFSAGEALAFTRQDFMHTALILVTGTVSEEFAASIIKMGADDYVLKDRLQRLPAAVEAAVRHRQVEKEKLESRQKLIESEERYRILVERISDGFIALDKEWRYTYANKKIGEMTHRDPQSLIGKYIWQEFPDAVGTETYRAFVKAMEEQQYVLNIDHYPPLSLWQENHIYPSPDGLSVFIRDITHSKRSEQELQSLKDRLYFHIENSPLGFIEWDEGLAVKLWSPQAQKIFGYTEEEVVAQTMKVISGELGQVLAGLKDGLVQGQVRNNNIQLKHVAKNNRLVYCQWFNSAVKDRGGNVTFMSLVLDVTERKMAEDNLKINELRLKEAQAITHISHWEVDLNSEAQIWSDEMYRILGLDKNEVSPTRELFMSLIHPGDFEELNTKISEAYYYLKSSGANFRFIRPDGSIRHGRSEWRVEYDENQKPARLYGIFQDITEAKEAEIELRNTNEELHTLSQHLQSVREEERIHIAREIHDELGQQLTGLKMNIAWLHKTLKTANDLVKEKLAGAIELIDETVKSVRRISASLRPSMLDDLGLLAALEWHSKEVEKRSEIKVNFEAPVQEPELSIAAATGIFRIFQELLTNAVRHANAHLINATLQLKGDVLLLVVADDGAGMDLSAGRAKKTLGLLGIKERTFLLGGKFDLQSQPGKGTVVTISIPLSNNKKID